MLHASINSVNFPVASTNEMPKIDVKVVHETSLLCALAKLPKMHRTLIHAVNVYKLKV